MANIIVKSDEKEVIKALCSLVEGKARTALSENSTTTFNLGLSGGSLSKFLCAGLPKIDTDWARWRLFFCDERLVPAENPDSTWGVYKSGLLEVTPLTEEQFLTVDTSLPPAAAAADYQSKLLSMAGSELKLDLLLLGAGPDGHTCSLFPSHPLLSEPAPPEGRVVAAITDSPKPPPERVTLTLPVVNSAHCCVFAATGSSKAGMVSKLLGDKEPDSNEDLPARMVKPKNGELYWILDTSAAKELML